jgi:hypothetical protein
MICSIVKYLKLVFKYFLKYLYGILNTIFLCILKYFEYFLIVFLPIFKYLYKNTIKSVLLILIYYFSKKIDINKNNIVFVEN